MLLLAVAQAYGLPDSYLSGGATRSRRSGRARPLRCARTTRSRCFVWLALPLPAYGLPHALNELPYWLCYALLARIARLVVSRVPAHFIAITGFACIAYPLFISLRLH